MQRWGAPVVTASFLTVGVQTLVNLAAGLARMPLRRYLPALVVGGAIWAFIYATVWTAGLAAWRRLWELSPVDCHRGGRGVGARARGLRHLAGPTTSGGTR